MRSTAMAAWSATGLAAASGHRGQRRNGSAGGGHDGAGDAVAATETTRAMTAQGTTRVEDVGRVSATGVVRATGQPSGDQPDRNLQHHRRDGCGFLHGIHAALRYASPVAGFGAEVESGGPAEVEVRFRSSDHESRLRVGCVNGAPDGRVEERDNRSGQG